MNIILLSIFLFIFIMFAYCEYVGVRGFPLRGYFTPERNGTGAWTPWMLCRRRRFFFFHPWLGGQFQLAKYACYQGTDIKTGQFHRDICGKFEVPGPIGAIWGPMADFFRKLHFLKCKSLYNFGFKINVSAKHTHTHTHLR